MPDPAATPTATTTAGNIIHSIRAQIPDPVTDPGSDGSAFSFQTLLRWMNDAMRIMATSAPIVTDWYGLSSVVNRSVYELPSYVLSVEQLWYDLWPCWRSAEADTIFTSRVSGNSYFFGPHSFNNRPMLHVWPQTSRTRETATLNTALASFTPSDNPSDLSKTVTGSEAIATAAISSSFRAFGIFRIEEELIWYQSIATDTFRGIVRGVGGSQAAAHSANATITECNIIFKCSRLPRPLTGTSDLVEVPIGLTPLIELYVLAKVREAEQEHQIALAMNQDFEKTMDKLQSSAQLKGIRQGTQVRTSPQGPALYAGRVYVP